MSAANLSSTADRQAAARRLVERGAVDVVVRDDLERKLVGPRPLRVKFGVDPTRPDLHLGHYVCFRKLREFQQLGHQIVVIIGDWTARIGDPSGRSVQRQMLTEEEVRENARTYLDQFFKVVDVERAEINWQSAWFGTFDLADVIGLTSKYTVAKMLAREDFSRRFADGSPIAITELLYPLLQAYDSVAVHADVEIGGTDQTFNLLVGRDIQREMGQEPQNILTVPILVGTDGAQKMSKSLGNYIAVTDPPSEMFGKIMSIPDAAMSDYLRLLTDVPDAEIDQLLGAAAGGEVNPRDVKARLATLVVSDLHGSGSGEAACDAFNRVFRDRELPEEMPELAVTGEVRILPLLVEAGLASSNRQARTLVGGDAVSLDGEKVTDPNLLLRLTAPAVLRVGRRFVRLVPTP
ncbi:MAG TPA: tyrosine--tRNA ligase [Thermomicrobiaceae bacterium]|nr:tyrosine--tRNA ligase [Thermomicrobiaceae bacterium]